MCPIRSQPSPLIQNCLLLKFILKCLSLSKLRKINIINHDSSVCPLVLQNSVLCVPFCACGAGGSGSKNLLEGAMKQMLDWEHSMRLLEEARELGTSSTRNQKTRTVSTSGINPGGLSPTTVGVALLAAGGACKSLLPMGKQNFRRQNTPENVTQPKTQIINCSQNLRFGVCCLFGCVWRPLRGEQRAPDNATHPKMQIHGTIDYLRFRLCCVFRCVLFSSENKLFGALELAGQVAIFGPFFPHVRPWTNYVLRKKKSETSHSGPTTKITKTNFTQKNLRKSFQEITN